MASYHLSIKNGKKGTATEHAMYIAREGKHGKPEKQADLVAKGHGNLPTWSNNDPITFWKMADTYERINGAAYREHELALPKELTPNQQLELAHNFISVMIGNKPYQYALHSPIASLGGVPQAHLHLMHSDRLPDGIDRPPNQLFSRHNPKHPEIGGCKKDSGGRDRIAMRTKALEARATWAEMQNIYLEKYGHHSRVDHRSHKSRGMDHAPEKHLGQSGIKKLNEEEKVRYLEHRNTAQK